MGPTAWMGPVWALPGWSWVLGPVPRVESAPNVPGVGKGTNVKRRNTTFVPHERDHTRETEMTKALVKTQIRLQQLVTKGEAGQGTLEYVGMIIVAAILVTIVVTVINGTDVAGKFTTAVNKIVGG